jgi:cell division protein FtsA
MRSKYICTLDLGSSKFTCCLAKLRKNGSVEGLFLESIPSLGMKRGRVIDIQGVSNTIDRLLKMMKVKSGVNIRDLYINVYGQDVTTTHSRTVIPLAEKRNKMITTSDIQRVTEEARLLGASLDEEIIQMMPFSFSVDDQDNIVNPCGLYGRKLGIDLFIISVKTAFLQGINRLINRLNYEIKHLFLSGLATSKVILREDLLKGGFYILCDIGADLSEITIFQNAVLQHVDTIGLGGNDLTEALRQAFKIPFELAEEIKCSYAYIIDPAAIREDKEVIIKKDDYYKVISQRKICEVITKQARSICHSIKEKIGSRLSDQTPVNKIFVAGRTVLVDGFIEMMEETLNIPTKLAASQHLPFVYEKKSPITSSLPQLLNYATSLGLLAQAIELHKKNKVLSVSRSKNLFSKVINHAKDLFQEYF